MANFLDGQGLITFWTKVKDYIKVNGHALSASNDGDIVLDASDVKAIALNGSSYPTSYVAQNSFYNGIGITSIDSTNYLLVSGATTAGGVRQIAIDNTNPLNIKTRTASYSSASALYTSWTDWNNLSIVDRVVTGITLPSDNWTQSVQGIYSYPLSNNASLGTLTSHSKIDISFNALGCKQIADDGISSIFVENNTGASGGNNVTVYSIGNKPSQAISNIQLFISETI